jgi:hypothetical protein
MLGIGFLFFQSMTGFTIPQTEPELAHQGRAGDKHPCAPKAFDNGRVFEGGIPGKSFTGFRRPARHLNIRLNGCF